MKLGGDFVLKSIREKYIEDSSILKAVNFSSFKKTYCLSFMVKENSEFATYILDSKQIADIIGVDENFLRENGILYGLILSNKTTFSFENKEQCENFISFLNEHKTEYATLAKLEEK